VSLALGDRTVFLVDTRGVFCFASGSTAAKWLLTAQGKKNIIPADMSDVLGDAARRVMGLEDMYGDYQATRARQGVVAKLLQSDRAACTQAAKMYVQYLLECLGDGARSKTRADITELVLAQLVPRLTCVFLADLVFHTVPQFLIFAVLFSQHESVPEPSRVWNGRWRV
jgi:hypothetical protein